MGKSAVPDSMYHNSSGTEYLCMYMQSDFLLTVRSKLHV